MMAKIVYLLCTATSTGCAVLLLRSYLKSKAALLLWSGLCFCLLALSNAILFIDLAVVQTDLSLYRTLLALAAIAMLLYGLIWEAS